MNSARRRGCTRPLPSTVRQWQCILTWHPSMTTSRSTSDRWTS